MKETYYFQHDYHARHDIKIEAMIADLKMEGYGIFWALIEMLYEENGYISITLYDRIANALRTSYDTITTIINNYELFEKDDKNFWSNSVLRRLEERKEKSNKAKMAVNTRWNKYGRNTVVSNRNTIKEKKRKEKKEYITFLPDGSFDWDYLLKGQRHIQIVGHYLKWKQIKIENEAQLKALIKRNLRPAQDLSGYSDQQITDAFAYMDNQKISGRYMNWTLETAFKYVSKQI